MIKKLEDMIFVTEHGDILGRRPNNEQIIHKINEIIEFLNNQPTLQSK